jgi:hypothetical protein
MNTDKSKPVFFNAIGEQLNDDEANRLVQHWVNHIRIIAPASRVNIEMRHAPFISENMVEVIHAEWIFKNAEEEEVCVCSLRLRFNNHKPSTNVTVLLDEPDAGGCPIKTLHKNLSWSEAVIEYVKLSNEWLDNYNKKSILTSPPIN